MNYWLSAFTFSAIFSINHLGVEVAPQIPTVDTKSGSRSVISSAEEMKQLCGLAFRHSSNNIFPFELFLPATK